jgi:tetratricopeptide (TPR) repeat protein
MRPFLLFLIVVSRFACLGAAQDVPRHNINMSKADLEAEKLKLESQLKTKPNSSFLHNQLAILELGLGNRGSYVREMKSAIRLDPRDPLNYFQLSETYRQWKQLARADLYLVKAAKVDPNNPLFRMRVGEMYDRRGDPTSAHSEYVEAKKVLQALQDGHSSEGGRVEKGVYYDSRGNAYTGASSLESSLDQHLKR